MQNPDNTLTNILIGNTLVNFALSFEGTLFILHQFPKLSATIGLTISIFSLTFILLLFGEIFPKAIAINRNKMISSIVAMPLYYLSYLITPIRYFILFFVKIFVHKVNKIQTKPEISQKDLNKLVSISHKTGVIDKDEKFLLSNIINTLEVNISEIMTPRDKIVAIQQDMTLKKIIEVIQSTRFNKILVYNKKKKTYTGFVNKKELILNYFNLKKSFNLKTYLKPILYVPPSKKVTDLLFDMQEKKIKTALVVNEYGGIDGLVTLNTILETLLDKNAQKHSDKIIKKLSRDSYILKGSITIDIFNKLFFQSLKSKEYDTLNGFLLELFGDDIPQINDSTNYENILFKIHKMNNFKIDEVLVKFKK